MTVFDKKELLKKELVTNGYLQGFENTVSAIVERISETSKCILACDYRSNKSVNAQSVEDGSRIRIGLKDRREHPITVIWDILHEFGHHLSGMPGETDTKLKRETQAWDKALEELKNYPQLINYKDNFNLYRERCLLTYKN